MIRLLVFMPTGGGESRYRNLRLSEFRDFAEKHKDLVMVVMSVDVSNMTADDLAEFVKKWRLAVDPAGAVN